MRLKSFSLISAAALFAFFLMGCGNSDPRPVPMDKETAMNTTSMKNGSLPPIVNGPASAMEKSAMEKKEGAWPPQPAEEPMIEEEYSAMAEEESAMAEFEMAEAEDMTKRYAKTARRASKARPRPKLAAKSVVTKGADDDDPLAGESLDMAAESLDTLDMDTDDSFFAADGILKRMKMANIAFNTPESMNIEKTELIRLILDMKKSTETLKGMIEATGPKVGASLRVSGRMRARLTGQNFQIMAITPELQALSGAEITEWKWDIKPEKIGNQRLHLTMSARIDVEGESIERTIQTFDRVIEVNVTAGQTIKTFVKNNWQWLWVVVLAPLGTFFWRKRRGKGGE